VILLDVNVLVYAHREETDRHADHRRWLEQTLNAPGDAPCRNWC